MIDQLSEKRKYIYTLSKLNNYKYREILKMHNISERTVEIHMRMVMMTVRDEMIRLCVVVIPVLLVGLSLFFYSFLKAVEDVFYF
ncbi:sigma factor-like helix-turn-helix DNA-binding protein [Aquimarina macrocephali]|uniref:sigma factor-like helix-turn-helix DNA-binding protein n=1 Tax=Aquimarina macrocephali TaxID=666563 RepID=UPI000A00FF1F|nr:sigma factor-like helix-turn-helix DNA-binding protein [Aquimarina macrocephali]